MKPYEAYIKQLSHNDSWNTPARVEFVYGMMKDELDLKGKKVLDLGCRFGLFSYLALELGAEYVVGVDFESTIIDEADRAFEALEVDPEKYCMSCNDVFNVNFMFYDVVLALGFLYNVPNQEFILRICRSVDATVLAEFWLDNSGENYPVLHWLTGMKTEESGAKANQEIEYSQYLPNLAYAVNMFERSGFSHKQMNEHFPHHCNVHFVLTPDGVPEPCYHRWGFNGRTQLSLL